MLPRGGKIEETGSGWRVSYYDGDKRRYKLFKTAREAKQFAAEVRGGYGELIVTLEDRAHLSAMRRAAQGAGVEMGEAVRRFVASLARSDDVLATDALDSFLLDCRVRRLRERTLTNYGFFVGALLDKLGPVMVSEINPEAVQRWVVQSYQVEVSRDTARAYVLGWLRWCKRKGWTAEDWDKKRVRDAVLRDEKRVPILAPDAFASVMDAAQENIRPALALMAFAGMRPEEVVSVDKDGLDWSQIDFAARVIEIPGAVAKTRGFRMLTGLPDNLWRWLECVPKDKRTGPVCPVQYRAFAQARRRAAVAAGVVWKHDVLRHSFATYAFHQLGVEHTIEIMGHTSPAMFFRHYKSAGSRDAAAAWFQI